MNTKEKNKKNKQKPTTANKTAVKLKKNNSNKLVWFALVIVVFTTFAIYFKAIKFGFVWDDDLYINTQNHINDIKWENIKLFFTEFFALNYQPVTILSYAIEYKLVGAHASLYHLNNIILHIINTILVFVLIRKISPKNIIVAIITTALFAVHPMHVESVAWVAGRKDVLFTFFFLFSLITYTNYLKSEKLLQLILTGIFFVMSCFSKSAAVILPLVMLLFDYYSNRKFTWKILFEKIPFFAISLIFGILALNSQKAAIPITNVIPVLDRIFIVSNSLITYICKAFLPINLSAFYPYPIESGNTLPVIYYLSILFVGFILFFIWYSRRWGKDVVFGFLFFLVTIILVLQIVSVGNATMADRYTYIPYIGIFFIIGKLFEYFYTKANIYYKNYFVIVLTLGFIIFSTISYGRVKIWENYETLFSDVMKKYPLNSVAYNNRGCYYLKTAQDLTTDNSVQKDILFRKSFQDFDKLVEIDESYYHVYYNRGLASYFLKDYANSIKDFDTEIQKNPKDEEAYFNRGNAKTESSDFIGAIKDFDNAIALNSKDENLYYDRGNVKKKLNDFTGAIKDFDKAIELNPKLIKAYNNRSILKCILKDYEGTVADYDKMIELNPKDTTTIKNRNIVKSLYVKSKK